MSSWTVRRPFLEALPLSVIGSWTHDLIGVSDSTCRPTRQCTALARIRMVVIDNATATSQVKTSNVHVLLHSVLCCLSISLKTSLATPPTVISEHLNAPQQFLSQEIHPKKIMETLRIPWEIHRSSFVGDGAGILVGILWVFLRYPFPLEVSTLRFLTFEGITIQLLQQGTTTAKHHVISRLDFFPRETQDQKTLVLKRLLLTKSCIVLFWKCFILCRYMHIHIWSISTRSQYSE